MLLREFEPRWTNGKSSLFFSFLLRPQYKTISIDHFGYVICELSEVNEQEAIEGTIESGKFHVICSIPGHWSH